MPKKPSPRSPKSRKATPVRVVVVRTPPQSPPPKPDRLREAEATLPRRHAGTPRREARDESGLRALRGSPVTEVICAAGGLVWRLTSQGRRLAVIRRERYGTEWTLPKGKLDPGEDWAEAALREVREETGCEASIESFAGGLTYQHDGRPKIVLFWNMKLAKDLGFEPSDEVSELLWLSPEQAVGLLTHPDERQLVASQPA